MDRSNSLTAPPILIADEIETERINRDFRANAKEIEETILIVAEAMRISFEEAVAAVFGIIQGFEEVMEKRAEPFIADLDDLAAMKPGDPLNITTAWDRKELREKLRFAERITASRLRQRKVKESAWAVRKRTGPRQREWRGPWRGEKN